MAHTERPVGEESISRLPGLNFYSSSWQIQDFPSRKRTESLVKTSFTYRKRSDLFLSWMKPWCSQSRGVPGYCSPRRISTWFLHRSFQIAQLNRSLAFH